MAGKIVVVGSSNTDMILQMDHIPRPGETILGGEFSMAAGGKGANQAVAAARAGGQVTFLARVGSDMFGQQAIEGFRRDGIDVQHVIDDPQAPSGVALIFVAADGENSIGVASGANARLSPQDVQQAAALIAAADVLVMQLETPLETVLAAAEIASQNDVTVILNPAPAQPLRRRAAAARVDPHTQRERSGTAHRHRSVRSAGCRTGRTSTARQGGRHGDRHTRCTRGVRLGRRYHDHGPRTAGDTRRYDRCRRCLQRCLGRGLVRGQTAARRRALRLRRGGPVGHETGRSTVGSDAAGY